MGRVSALRAGVDRPTDAAALLETRRAFDGVAAAYDRANAENPILRGMRARARHVLESRVAPGSHVLDLGCGPGTDEAYLAACGYRVTAIDWSPAMVAEARRRVSRAGVDDRVGVLQLGIQQLDLLAPATFDAAYSSFGALNCVPNPEAAARVIASRLRPGAVLVASVIGRFCPWEIALYAARGQWRRALLRFASGLVPVPLEGRIVWTRYDWPHTFARCFASAGFELVSIRALGLLAPPPYLQAFASRHPRVVRALERADDCIGGWPIARHAGDHFLIVLQKGGPRARA